jgi:tripartite-type tricarboxylate transporter receptor subunit TctC
MRLLAFFLQFVFVLTAAAQDWPRQKAIHIVVGFAPASTTDLVARLIAPRLGEALGQSVIVENKPGAGGNVAAQQAKRAAPDGYTLFVTSVAYAVNPSLYADAGYDPFTDFAPVILGPSTPNIITVNPAVPAKNLQELIALARREKLSYASSGIGTTTHLSMERIKTATKVDITHVPYQPAQAVGAAVAGHTQISSTSMPPAVTHVKAGRVRAIAVTSAQRSPALPDVPTTAELGQPRLLSSTWFALLAPKGTPASVVARLNAVSNEILADPAVRKRLAEMGASTLGGTSQQLAEHLAAETEKWGRLVRDARISTQ